jgi:hypothetical protein
MEYLKWENPKPSLDRMLEKQTYTVGKQWNKAAFKDKNRWLIM